MTLKTQIPLFSTYCKLCFNEHNDTKSKLLSYYDPFSPFPVVVIILRVLYVQRMDLVVIYCPMGILEKGSLRREKKKKNRATQDA